MDIARNLVDAARNFTASTARTPTAPTACAPTSTSPTVSAASRAASCTTRATTSTRRRRAARRGRARDAQAVQAPARLRAPRARRDRRGDLRPREHRAADGRPADLAAARRAGAARDARRPDRALRRRAAGAARPPPCAPGSRRSTTAADSRGRRRRRRRSPPPRDDRRTPSPARRHGPSSATASTRCPGLQRIYRRGRLAMRAARKDPSAEHLHEWRKRVKDLWHATEIVGAARPKQLKRLPPRAQAVEPARRPPRPARAARYVEAHPQCFDDDASRARSSRSSTAAPRLCEKALARGRKLYGR